MSLFCSIVISVLLDTRHDIPPSDQLTNVFVAVRPPWPVAEQFYSRATELCSSARIIGSRRPFFILHMTLFSIGGARGRIPYAVLKGLDGAISMVQFPAFDIVLDEARSFENRRDSVPFVLEGGELTDVHALRLAVLDALRVRDFRIPVRSAFSPHMTLAYARRRSPRISVEPFSWKAYEFQLIESWVGKTKYVELARWSLRDDEPPASGSPPVLAPMLCRNWAHWEGDGAAYVT
jgi:RNA 2',3'-cyclic 3'-phosphodiesterase